MSEKRKSLRIPVSMRVDCEGIDPIVFGYAQNLSLEGLALSVQFQDQKNIDTHSTVKIKFMLPGSATALSIKAKIIRISEDQSSDKIIGLRFFELSEIAKKEISFFVAHTN